MTKKEMEAKRNLNNTIVYEQLKGRWRYSRTVNEVKDLFNYSEGKNVKTMPEFLFFGENLTGTDLKNTFAYTNFGMRNFITGFDWDYFLLYSTTLGVYKKNRHSKKPLDLHIYSSTLTNEIYNPENINILIDKYSIVKSEEKVLPFDKTLKGKWNLVNKIKESKVETYNGRCQKIEDGQVYGLVGPVFNALEIISKNDVRIMNPDDKLTITSKGEKPTVITYDTIKLTVEMTTNPNEFKLYDSKRKERYRATRRTIGKNEFLFVDVELTPALDIENLYVYKKEK